MNFLIETILNKIDSLLTRQRVVAYSRAILLTIVLLFLIGSFTGQIDTGILFKADFSAFYTAGLIIKESGDAGIISLYDLDKQISIQKEYGMIEGDEIPRIFINPPVYAWLMVPFSNLPYSLAISAWLVINVLVALLSVIILIKHLNIDLKWWDAFIIFLASYAGFSAIYLAQNTFIFIGLYAVSYVLLIKRHDFTAGFILGFGALKPQLFIFLPIVLLFQKKWNALTGFALSFLLLTSASVLLIGPEGIVKYLNLFNTNIYLYGIHAQIRKMHSFPALIRLTFGIELNAVYLAIFAFIFLMLAFGYKSFKRGCQYNNIALLSLAILGSIIVSPHLFHYDLALLLFPVMIIYSWTVENKPNYFQTRNYRLALFSLYIYLWLSHFIIDTIRVQLSVLLIIYLFIITLKNSAGSDMANN